MTRLFGLFRTPQQTFGALLFNHGLMAPLGVSFIQETTVFREYGPLSGSTMRLSYEGAPKFGNSLSRQTVDLDARYYMRIGANGVFALRAYGFKSMGDTPGYTFFGGNSEMRGYDYREFLGNKGFYGNAELRFPLINAMATPIGILGGIRGVFFFNLGTLQIPRAFLLDGNLNCGPLSAISFGLGGTNPAEFDQLRQIGLEMGFKHVASGPLVRSSYEITTSPRGCGPPGSLRSIG